MQDWDQYRKQLMGRVMELGTLSPDTLKGYQQLSSAGSKSGVLDGKTRELISLAVAVTTRCDGCIAVHADAALKQGASRAEIADALGVAVAMNAGPPWSIPPGCWMPSIVEAVRGRLRPAPEESGC
ncbi:carboxymuconolactone decarboxylase family protein [Aeromonas hydrophila]|uniref:carboxymuconolactone decarboxylase family protein n=1 Tax=Aeromonas hydrophila TaxID=644 RepID=UPI0020B26D87|nr:carboxymuconolactone decarboxylase family protein [Aeromonas hydrophila]